MRRILPVGLFAAFSLVTWLFQYSHITDFRRNSMRIS